MRWEAVMQAQLQALAQWSEAATADFVKTQGVAPGRWLQLERDLGTLGACKHLLQDHPESYWVPILQSAYDRQRLHWSVEAAALRPEFATLFTDQERAIAKQRLAAFGFDVKPSTGTNIGLSHRMIAVDSTRNQACLLHRRRRGLSHRG